MRNIAEQITEGLDRFYKAFQRKRVLKSLEEISATTNEDDVASATAVAALSNNLTDKIEKLKLKHGVSYGNVQYWSGATGALSLVKYDRLCILSGYIIGTMEITKVAQLQYPPVYRIEAPAASDGGHHGYANIETDGGLYLKRSGGGSGCLRVCIPYICK